MLFHHIVPSQKIFVKNLLYCDLALYRCGQWGQVAKMGAQGHDTNICHNFIHFAICNYVSQMASQLHNCASYNKMLHRFRNFRKNPFRWYIVILVLINLSYIKTAINIW